MRNSQYKSNFTDNNSKNLAIDNNMSLNKELDKYVGSSTPYI